MSDETREQLEALQVAIDAVRAAAAHLTALGGQLCTETGAASVCAVQADRAAAREALGAATQAAARVGVTPEPPLRVDESGSGQVRRQLQLVGHELLERERAVRERLESELAA